MSLGVRKHSRHLGARAGLRNGRSSHGTLSTGPSDRSSRLVLQNVRYFRTNLRDLMCVSDRTHRRTAIDRKTLRLGKLTSCVVDSRRFLADFSNSSTRASAMLAIHIQLVKSSPINKQAVTLTLLSPRDTCRHPSAQAAPPAGASGDCSCPNTSLRTARGTSRYTYDVASRRSGAWSRK